MALGWWRRRSLRARLTAAATVASAAALAVAGVLLVDRVRAELLNRVDTAAAARAQDAVAALEAGHVRSRLGGATDDDAVVQVVARDGAVVASTPNTSGRRLFTFAPTGQTGVRTIHGLPVGDGTDDSQRVVVTAVSRPDGRYLVYSGQPLGDVTESVTTLTGVLVIVLPALTAVMAGLTWLLVGRALRPVETLRRQAAVITATDLHRRVDVPPSRDELSRLAATLNDLLGGLEASMRRQREFVADAAHELRSPVAALLAQHELRARQTQVAGDQAMAEDVRRLSRLVDDLLTLARLDAHPQPVTEVVDLDDIVFDEVTHLRLRTGLLVDTSRVSAGQIRGQAGMLARVVRNLLDNAARHAHRQISVSLTQAGDEAVLVVADDGPGIRAPDRQRIFERFTRLDDARSRDAGGVGLGLAIVGDVVTAHRGRVLVEDNNPGTRVVVRLPTAPGDGTPA